MDAIELIYGVAVGGGSARGNRAGGRRVGE